MSVAPAEQDAQSSSPAFAPRFSIPSLPFLLFVLALAVRVGFMLVSHGLHFVETTGPYPMMFENETTNISCSIANGYGFKSPFVGTMFGDPGVGPTSWVGPVYPYLCALVFRLFGVSSRPSLFVIVLLQCVLSALTVIPIVRAGELTVGRRAALLAAGVWAVFPWFSRWANTYIWEISLSALLFTCLFWFALRLRNNPSWGMWAGFGAFAAFAILANPALLTLFAGALLWLAVCRWHLKLSWFRHVLLAVATCALCISPWLIRNRVVFGQWAFVRTNFGFELWMANYHGSKGRDWAGRSATSNLAERAEYDRLGELAYVKNKAQIAHQFIRTYPAEFLELSAKRFLMFWDGTPLRYSFPAAGYWLSWSFLPMTLLFIISLVWACWRRVHGALLYVLACVLYPLPYYITSTQARYRHALEPLMLLLIAYAALEVFRLVRGPAPRPATRQLPA